MPTDITIVPVDYKGNEANRFFFEPFYQMLREGEWASIFQIDTTIPSGGSRKMLLGGTMSAPLRIDTGCGGDITARVAVGERTLNTTAVKGLVGLCKDDFQRSVISALVGKTIGKDLMGTFIFDFALTTMKQSMQAQLVNNAFFGNRTSTDATMNLTDGLFSVLLPQAKNDGMPNVDSFGGVALGAGDAIEYLTQMINAQTNELDGVDASMKTFLISRAVYQQLKIDIRTGVTNSNLYASEVIEGRTIERFDGIKLKKMSKFDELWYNLNNQQNGNLAILMADGVLQMGTDGQSASNQIETWYEKKDQMNYIRPSFSFGFNYYSEKLMVGGYKKP